MISDILKRRIPPKLRNPLILVIFVCLLITCIDPFNPDLKGTTSILIVDGLITNENSSYVIKLSRTSQNQNTQPVMVTGAHISIRDNENNTTDLFDAGGGIYRTDSLLFRGETGKAYTLYIETAEGIEYESDPCVMYPVEPIDRIDFVKDQEFTDNGSQIQDGIRILIDSENSGDGKYLRWVYKEWWEFKVPEPKLFEYIREEDIRPVEKIKQVCWANSSSSEIIIKSTEGSQTNSIENQPVLFIDSDLSNRLLIQYYVEISQLSLSKTEFEFWDQMGQINEGGVDIFDKQPFAVPSNIHSITNPQEMVLGYFQVSAVERKSIYIMPDDIKDLEIPLYEYKCDRLELGPDDYPGARMTFDKIYASFLNSSYTFTEPIYDMRWNLSKLVFAKHFCANCTSQGSLTKPDFWVDIESKSSRE